MTLDPTPESLTLPDGVGIDALFLGPEKPRCLLLLAHSAGAGMEHRGMEALARELAARRVATLRYQFPYMQAGGRRPDRAPKLIATVRAAARAARDLAAERLRGVPVFAGGRSMGGRMTSMAEAESPLGVEGLLFFAFPLHPAGKPGTARAEHLDHVELPMLFLQGTRDKLSDRDLMEPVLEGLPRASCRWLEGADHSFHVLKRSGRTDAEVMEEIGDAVQGWLDVHQGQLPPS